MKTKRRFRKELSSDDEDSNDAESSAGESQHGFEPTNCSPQPFAQSPVLLHSASYSSGSLPRAIPSLPLGATYTYPPSILVSHDPEGDVREQHTPIEMMDTTTDFFDDVHSPYLMVSVPSPEQIAPSPAAYSSSTYADSLFESDMDDLTTDTDFDIDLCERETIFQHLLRPTVHCLLTAYSSSRQNAPGNSGQQSSNSSYSSSLNGHGGASGSKANNLSNLSPGGKRRRTLAEEDDGNDDEQPPKRKSKAARNDEDLPPLACPFVKFDPLKHEKCYTFVLKGVSRVK